MSLFSIKFCIAFFHEDFEEIIKELQEHPNLDQILINAKVSILKNMKFVLNYLYVQFESLLKHYLIDDLSHLVLTFLL